MSPSYTAEDLARLVDAEVVGDGGVRLNGVRALDAAGPGDLSFFTSPKYAAGAAASRAGAILTASPEALAGWRGAVLVAPRPFHALVRAIELLRPPLTPPVGIHPSAVVADDADLGTGIGIGALCAVGDGSAIGDRTIIGAGCVLGRNVRIGVDCVLHPRVVVEDGCRIGDRCVVHAGTVIGADGFGFETVDGEHLKVPQVGIVVVEDDVEIGANVTIDRAALEVTRIGRGTKLDNLVQVAHNVSIGQRCLLAAQVGIAGSATVGDRVMLGGQAGVSDHVRIVDDAVVAARAAVFRDVHQPGMYSGTPARPHAEWMRSHAEVARLARLRDQVRRLEERLAVLEGGGG